MSALLVSCPNVHGGLYILDAGAPRRILPELKDVRGIAMRPPGEAIVAQSDELLRVRLFPEPEVVHRLSVPMSDFHDIAIVGGQLLAVATRRSRIGVRDLDTFALRMEYRFHEVPIGDSIHLNSVWATPGRIITSQFAEEWEGGRPWREAPPGMGIIKENGVPIVRGISQPHNVGIEDGELRYCESNRGVFVWGRRRAYLGGFARGVAFDVDRIHVGLSSDRCDRFPEPKHARVVTLDRATLDVVEDVPIPTAREVFAIACMEIS